MQNIKGLLHLYIGNGKGKTTAAVGLAVRALGWDKRVLFSQFLKSGESGEKNSLERLEGLEYFRPNLKNSKFIWNMTPLELEQTKQDILEGWGIVKQKALSGQYHLVIMDELLDAADCGFIPYSDLIELINQALPHTEIVMTGRKAEDRLMEKADYVSEISALKHPYQKGIKARKGIEY